MEKKISEKLARWQQRLQQSDNEWKSEVADMDKREKRYNGGRTLSPLVEGDTKRNGQPKKTSHVRNIIFENIESQVSSTIPQPKVTPRRKKDERLANIIEHFLRNELDRLPFETINDMAERTVPIQGGTGFLVEWDNTKRTHSTVGEIAVTLLHPKQFGPQPGVYTGIRDMDWFITKMPTTKETVRRKYGVDLTDEGESEPDIRSADGKSQTDDSLTLYIGFEINERGGINRFEWVNDIELLDLTDYQARRQPVCRKCGRVRPLRGQVLGAETQEGNLLPDPTRGFAGGLIPQELTEQEIAGGLMAEEMAGGVPLDAIPVNAQEPKPERYDGGPCPWCGADDWTTKEQEYEQILLPVETALGNHIDGAAPGLDENGNPVMKPTMVPFYKPDLYPIVLQKSVSVYGKLLGNSDVDRGPAEHHQPHRAEDHRPTREGRHEDHTAGQRKTAHRSRGRRALVHRLACGQGAHWRLRLQGRPSVRAALPRQRLRGGAADPRHHGQLSGPAGLHRDERKSQGVLSRTGGGTP